ncbi:hypothetical protein LTR66_009395, partial [Elasticomyces elasticus]
MAARSMESILEAPLPGAPASPQTVPLQAGEAPKLRGRKKLFQSLQRISSSPSLAKMGRSPSSGYRSGGRASASCVSLSSPGSPYDASNGSCLASELSVGYSTAPTSAASTPGLQTPFFNDRARVRFAAGNGKTSVPVPYDFVPNSRLCLTPDITEVDANYFSRPVAKPITRRENFNFWGDMPAELRMSILQFLEPREIVRCSAVSKSWYRMCFDGQLWSNLDTTGFYREIPADALVGIITAAGPFVRDLNLRGCVQLRDRWHTRGLSDACRNLENFCLEGCRIDRTSIHCFLLQNTRLVHINLSGLAGATNAAMKIIAQYCPKVEHLNVSWCNNVDTRGLRKVVEACPKLRDLRAGEVRGWDDEDLMQELFARNTLERLILMNCDSLSDESLAILMHGKDPEIDILTDRAIVPPRRLKHLDLTRCRCISDKGVRTLAANVPNLEGLQLSKCNGVVDASLTDLFLTTPNLTHLDLEELDEITNATLQALAVSPCARRLKHLSISYCENLGDTGMLPIFKSCTALTSVDMDNTRVSDLVLAEAAALNRSRSARTTEPRAKPTPGLRLVAYDCQNVTWTGVREILSRN